MLIGAMTLALGGCTRLPPMRVGDPGTSRKIDVLTFNIEGLGEALVTLTDREQAPDVVLVQEMFTPPPRPARGNRHARSAGDFRCGHGCADRPDGKRVRSAFI